MAKKQIPEYSIITFPVPVGGKYEFYRLDAKGEKKETFTADTLDEANSLRVEKLKK